MIINNLIEYIDEFTNIYIRFKGHKIALSIEIFKEHHANWRLYSIRRIYVHGDDLIIEIYKV